MRTARSLALQDSQPWTAWTSSWIESLQSIHSKTLKWMTNADTPVYPDPDFRSFRDINTAYELACAIRKTSIGEPATSAENR
jgi:hypothetical protein